MESIGQVKLNSAIECFAHARHRIADGMRHLYDISESKLWDNGEYSSFGEFCETGCGISSSFGSKLVKVYKHYAIEGGIEPSKIAQIDSEKLYLGIGLKMAPEAKLSVIEASSRRDIKDSLAENDGVECTHPELIQICNRCHRRVQ